MAYYYDNNNGFRPENSNRGSTGNNGKKDNDAGSWIIIAIMFAIGLWPVGLIMLISKLTNTAGRSKSQAPRMGTASGTNSQSWQTQRTAAQATRTRVTQTPQYSNAGASAMRVVGIVLLCIGILAMLGVVNAGVELFPLLYSAGIVAGGLALWQGGITMARRSRRFAKYMAIIGAEASAPLSRLAAAVNKSEKQVSKDLELMIEKNFWGDEAYVDLGSGMFFRTREAANFYEQDHKAAQSAAAAEPEAAEEGYSGILRNIRRANDNIADPILSQKIDRLEEVAGKIFRIIEAEPAKKEKASTFLNYYLPTTQKLLDSYAEFESAGVQGENLETAKAKIQKTMDAIVAGFEHQLDELYQANAMDVESDIRVMETMLKRDSASAAKDFGLGSTAVQQDTQKDE
jgi:5-bromo-4-chloroindolyl phosphate hydrolysis protein